MTGLAPVLLNAQGAGDKIDDDALMGKAKQDLFDRNWNAALKKLDQLIDRSPNSSHYSMALFYKGRCLKELNKSKQALATFTQYLEVSKNMGLKEEALKEIIDLNFQLAKGTDRHYLKAIVDFLDSKDAMVRYYAAFKLSYAKDKKMAEKAVPVLKRIVRNDDDEDLVDRAKLALMRINPRFLKEDSETRPPAIRLLCMSVYDKKEKKETFAITFPFGLAKLALEAIPEEEKELIKKEGYNLDRILETLTRVPEVIKIEGDDVIFKIWVK
jgi:tetratricopeptide (TPR) repeat protein